MKEQFEDHNFRGKTLAKIEQANAIIDEYMADRIKLSLRQLYYQFVARNLMANKQANYKSLGALLSKARLGGYVDWDAFEDRGRHFETPHWWSSPEDAMHAISSQYQEPLWDRQPRFVVVLVEKDALLGVVTAICEELRVPYMSCRGHMSQTEMYTLGKLLADKIAEGYEPHIIYAGDLDPSGWHMSHDVLRRLSLFAGQEIDVNRIALNMDQVRALKLPPNPAKEQDARYAAYVREFGTRECWETDAINPRTLTQMIRDAVMAVVDADLWNEDVAKEKRNKAGLRGVYDDFSSVERYLRLRHVESAEHEYGSADDVLNAVDDGEESED